MKRRIAAAAVAVCFATPAVAQAPAAPAFDSFKQLCADTGGVYARASTAPQLESWSKFPLPIPIPATSGAKIRSKTIRVKSMGKGSALVFFAGQGDFVSGKKTSPFDFCAVGGRPGNMQDALRQVRAWTGQQPIETEKGVMSVRYHESGGKRTPLGPGKVKELAGTLSAGTLVSVDVAERQGTTMISHTVVRL